MTLDTSSNPVFDVNADTFSRRLKEFYSSWDNKAEAWGNAQFIAVATPVCTDDLVYWKSSALYIWLFGHEFHETVMVFMKNGIHVICSQWDAQLFGTMKNVLVESFGIDLFLHIKLTPDAHAQMEEVFESIKKESAMSPPVVGLITKEDPEGLFSQRWTKALKNSGFNLVDVTIGFQELFARKDEREIMFLKKAASLSATVLNDYVLPRLKTIIKEKEQIAHSSLMDDTDEVIRDPNRVHIQLESNNVDICYGPIFQSGGVFDLRPSAQSDEECLSYEAGGVIICSLGSRYNFYCSNIARTFIVQADKVQEKAYRVLLKAHETATASLCPGKVAADAYRAALEVVQHEGPEFLPHFTKMAGTGIGIEFRETGLNLNLKNNRLLEMGMVFNVSLGFVNLPSERNTPHTRIFSLILSDTVIIGKDGPENATVMSPKTIWNLQLPCTASEKEQFSQNEHIDNLGEKSGKQVTGDDKSCTEDGRDGIQQAKCEAGCQGSNDHNTDKSCKEDRRDGIQQAKSETGCQGSNDQNTGFDSIYTQDLAVSLLQHDQAVNVEQEQGDLKRDATSQKPQPDLTDKMCNNCTDQNSDADNCREQQFGYAKQEILETSISNADKQEVKKEDNANVQQAISSKKRHRNSAGSESNKLDTRKQKMHRNSSTGVTSNCDGSVKALSCAKINEELVAYQNVDDIPFSRDLMIQIDHKKQTVLLPIYGQMVPFHISTIQNVSSQHDDANSFVHIVFNVPNAGYEMDDSSPEKFHSYIYLKEIAFHSRDTRHINQVEQLVKGLKQQASLRDHQKIDRSRILPEGKIKTIKPKPYKLSDVWMRPSFDARKGRVNGLLEVLSNGLRFSTRHGEKIDILFKNIKHAFYQPTCEETKAFIHFHLNRRLVIGESRTKDVQFCSSMYSSSIEPANKQLSGHAEEKGNMRNKHNANAELGILVKRISEIWQQPHMRELHLEFDELKKENAFHAIPYRTCTSVIPTERCLVELMNLPFVVIAIADIEIVSLERIGNFQNSFDMVVIFKGYNHNAFHIDTIPMKSLDRIKGWLNSANIKYYESSRSINWNSILEIIKENPKEFSEGGGWEFLNLKITDSETENSQESNQHLETEDSEMNANYLDHASAVESDKNSEEEGKMMRSDEMPEARNTDGENVCLEEPYCKDELCRNENSSVSLDLAS